MADIVNLKTFRKEKARRVKDAEASANRTKFGRTKADKIREREEEARGRDKHEAHRIVRDEDNTDPAR
ncbi:DUF4169 family protein [Marivibrio halodurans]|uniref:DUF4169 family protein n=1 Tax=Marivibrio halodurans TaxID=2039722 RepID=A0A8J7S8L9_9PROT|nr:DUF4169 family protein [Marivibrio halodurans]MBP5857392.1 DUF4169 family protein [Marivibrio halodurans]